MKSARRTERGASIVELLFYAFLSCLVSYAGASYWTVVSASTARTTLQQTSRKNAGDLLAELRRKLKERMIPATGEPTSLEFVDSAGFVTGGAGECQDLKIRYRRREAGAIVIKTALFQTVCEGTFTASAPRPHVDSACAGKRSKVAVQYFAYPDETTPERIVEFPLSEGAPSAALCLRQQASGTQLDGVLADVGGIYRGSSKYFPYLHRLALSLKDTTGAGVEFISH